MKALIIFFSQTGNTRRIAECIRDGVMGEINQCEISALSDVDVSLLSNYDVVGIGSPVFYYREPFNVEDFIEALPELNGQHWFVFCTHGNVVGNFFPSVMERLKTRGATVIGCHDSYADITVPFYPKPSYTSGHPDSHDLEDAREFGRMIAKHSLEAPNQGIDICSVSYPVSSEEWIQDSNRLTREVLEKVTPKLSINVDTCIECYECEKNCPVHGISIAADPPRIQTPCIYCWRCVNVCPTLSIGADWEALVRMAPANYARYRKELQKVAARGAFRWLIDPDIVNLDDPLYKQREREMTPANKPDDDVDKEPL